MIKERETTPKHGDHCAMRKQDMVKVREIEAEFEEPIEAVLRGFIEADGYAVGAAAQIIELPLDATKELCEQYSIHATGSSAAGRLVLEMSSGTRRKVAETLRRRAGHPPIEWRGRIWTFPELARETGIPPDTIRMRINKCGWSVDRAIKTPVQNHGPFR